MPRAMKYTMPSEKQIKKLVLELTQMRGAVDGAVVDLTPAEKRRALKSRRGGEPISDLVARLGTQWKFAVGGASPGEIVLQRARAARLKPLKQASEALARSLRDAVFDAESKAWAATTSVYSLLRDASHRDGALKAELAPATEFFATGKRKPKAAPTPAPTPSTPSTPPLTAK